MDSDQSNQGPEEERALVQENEQKTKRPLYFLPHEVQLLNTFCIEIIAKRYPVEIVSLPAVNVNLEEVQVDPEHLQAQVIVHVQTIYDNIQSSFDISFKIVGIFAYSENYKEEQARSFLEQGSLSILLPFARELLFNICARLQVPPMMLTMVQLAPHPPAYKATEEDQNQNDVE